LGTSTAGSASAALPPFFGSAFGGMQSKTTDTKAFKLQDPAIRACLQLPSTFEMMESMEARAARFCKTMRLARNNRQPTVRI
jgi:hypothetical protein